MPGFEPPIPIAPNSTESGTPLTIAPLAIIGAACRLPGGSSLAAFRHLLFSAACAVTEIPDGRWTKERFYDPRPGQPGKSYTFAAGCLPDVKGFDAAFFGMSPREAVHVDPQQRLMLELVQEALEDAGLPAAGLGARGVGVYVGGSSFDYSAQGALDTAFTDAYSMQGGALSSLSNRISYVYDLHGPSFTVDTACSSTMVALHLAATALARGEIGMAIVGGVNLLLSPQSFIGFSRASMLSKAGRCHAFDARADGYARAEGGGVLILTGLRAAQSMGAEIHAVIEATGMNSDGRTQGFSLPNGAAQAELLRRVYAGAGISPDTLGYFEAHGTGTPVGDPIEAEAIGTALGQKRASPLPIGSVKPNVGHLEAASAIASLMKSIISLRERRVPRSILNETPNPIIPFGALNLSLLHEPIPLAPGARIGVNSFGFGGTNAHAVLAPAPEPAPAAAEEAQAALPPLLLSAHSAAALRALASEWQVTAARTAAPALPARLRGQARGRDQHTHRAVLTAGTPAQLADQLAGLAEGDIRPGVVTGEAVQGRLAFVFSGNGSQWAGMGQDALALSPDFRAALATVEAALTPRLGWSVTERLAAPDPVAIRDTSVAQPLLFAVQAALAIALRARGIVPDAVVGHSAGEVAAALTAGALTLDQAAWVIAARSRHQQDTHDAGRMAALGLGEAEAASAIAEVDPRLEISAINATGAVTIAGPHEAIAALEAWAAGRGVFCAVLDLDYAFHSRAMDPIEAPLLRALAGLAPAAPRISLVSTVTGSEVTDTSLGAEYWWHNVRQPVNFVRAARHLVGAGVRIFAEIGPQPVLQPYLRDAFLAAGVRGRNFGTLARDRLGTDPVSEIAARCHAAGASIAGTAAFDGATRVRGLPGTQWQREPYWTTPTVEALHLIDPARDHPLLGFRNGAGPGHWSNHLSADGFPWLADHVVSGKAVMPAAAMIDMALAAAASLHPGAPALEIEGLEISQFLPLDPGMTRECDFAVLPDGRFTLASRVRLDDSPLTKHAAGRLRIGTHATRRPRQLSAAHRVVEADTIYAAARKRQLEYGPAFRTVNRVVTFNADEARVELAPVNELPAEEGWLLHPAVVDGALHALMELAADPDNEVAETDLVVPWRFGRIALLRPEGGMPASALLRIRKRGPRAFAAEISFFDAAGALLAEFGDCWFVKVTQAAAAPAAQFFRTALCPAPVQPPRSAIEPETLLPDGATPAPAVSVALADAFLATSLAETMSNAAPLPEETVAEPMLRLALSWLEADGLAERRNGHWEALPDPDLPEADDLWRTIFYEVPDASAELTAASTLASLLSAQLRGRPGETETVLSPVLQDQMLAASATANAAIAALRGAVSAFLAHWPPGKALRVVLTGHAAPELAAGLADLLAEGAAHLRMEVRPATDGQIAALEEALEDRANVSVQARAGAPAAVFDLVIGLWALGGPAPVGIAALTSLLAPGGTLITAEPEGGRLIELLRRSGAWSPDGHAADAAVLEMAAEGLDIAGPRRIGGEVWSAALLAARAEEAQDTEPVLPRPCAVIGGGNSTWGKALRAVLPGAEWHGAFADAAPAALAGSDVLVLLPEEQDEAKIAALLPGFLAELAAFAVALDAVEDARLVLVARGAAEGGILPVVAAAIRRVIANETGKLACRAIRIDSALPRPDAAAALRAALASPDTEPDAVLTAAGLLVPRLRAGLPSPREQNGPVPDWNWKLDTARPGLLSSLAWEPVAHKPLAPDEVRIKVAAAALNFRDVMWALALLPDEALLDGFSGAGLGLECAGTVTETGSAVGDLQPGDRVIAVAPAAMASSVVTQRRAVLPVPDDLDLVAAATMPVAFMTAVYALGHAGRLRAGERVLIHGGAGGVGLAAIQYALHRGAVVYATAGDPARRAMLRRLGVAEVFDSRSARFYDDVLASTGGEGVDLVLNSLAGELMERSLGLLRPFGRFLEIGKRDLYENSTVGIRPLRHNISYLAIDVDELAAKRPEEAGEVLAEIATLMADGQIRPLPFRRFGFSHAAGAFRQMQASGHVGKIVLTPDGRETAAEAGKAASDLDPRGIFVITGGLTGFGLQSARWLVAHGARRLALVSRRGPATPGTDILLAGFAADGVNATAHACDVSDPAALGALLKELRAEGAPIKGVLHAAMVISDANLSDQDAARFHSVIAPKLAGAIALDRLTRNDKLDLFVLFSSITTAVGNPGQANYIAANAALEAIATRRRAEGRPGLAVCWGPIGDAGYLTGEQRVSDMLEKVMGARHLTAAEALAKLPAALASGQPVVGIANVRWEQVRKLLPRIADPLMSELKLDARGDGDTGSLRAELIALPPDEAQARMVEILRAELSRILRLSPESLAADREVSLLGVDSLMAVELRMALETRIGVDLPLLSLADKPTLNGVAARVLKQVLAQGGEAGPLSERDRLAAIARQYETIDTSEAAAE